jgi:hypothetical protein
MKLVDLKTLAKMTSLSVFTHRKYIKMGMPHYRAGRKILVSPEEFYEWFQQFRTILNPADDSLEHIVNETLNKMGLG